MKAAAFLKTGDPSVIELMDLPDPAPGPDEVLIRTKAVGLNFADIYRRRGEYEVEPPSPYVLGMEGAGIVVRTGGNVKNLAIGSRVGFAHIPAPTPSW